MALSLILDSKLFAICVSIKHQFGQLGKMLLSFNSLPKKKVQYGCLRKKIILIKNNLREKNREIIHKL